MSTAEVPHMRDQAFVQLVETHGDSLLRMCCLYLNDRHLEEDAVQDTFVKAYRSLARFRGDCSEKTWLMRIAINTCKNYRRSPWHRWVDGAFRSTCCPSARRATATTMGFCLRRSCG